ncbi:hypothetical protein RRG08_057829 [Elysia crispata]|uniref:Uncharacterized protein n=1 Tax=Elysia crispata TaxID=231223 RepID=A0AAE1AZ57_9GAST|nr:hypothetical protein RRG08_057829 [Elysia crispata]
MVLGQGVSPACVVIDGTTLLAICAQQTPGYAVIGGGAVMTNGCCRLCPVCGLCNVRGRERRRSMAVRCSKLQAGNRQDEGATLRVFAHNSHMQRTGLLPDGSLLVNHDASMLRATLLQTGCVTCSSTLTFTLPSTEAIVPIIFIFNGQSREGRCDTPEGRLDIELLAHFRRMTSRASSSVKAFNLIHGPLCSFPFALLHRYGWRSSAPA